MLNIINIDIIILINSYLKNPRDSMNYLKVICPYFSNNNYIHPKIHNLIMKLTEMFVSRHINDSVCDKCDKLNNCTTCYGCYKDLCYGCFIAKNI